MKNEMGPEISVLCPEEPVRPRGQCQGFVRVDEGQDFFFDHPLDHASGIFLVTALDQFLKEIAGKSPLLEQQNYYIKKMNLNFRCFCEKNQVIQMTAFEAAASVGGVLMEVRAEQGGHVVCDGLVELQPYENAAVHPPILKNLRKIEGRQIHKQLEKNILISEFEKTGSYYCSRIFVPQKGHILCGDRDVMEMPLLFETVRQFHIALMHGKEGIPFGARMVLLSMKTVLEEPVHKDSGVTVSLHEKQHISNKGTAQSIFRWKSDLSYEDGPAGSCTVMYSIVDEEKYNEIRYKNEGAEL